MKINLIVFFLTLAISSNAQTLTREKELFQRFSLMNKPDTGFYITDSDAKKWTINVAPPIPRSLKVYDESKKIVCTVDSVGKLIVYDSLATIKAFIKSYNFKVD